MKTIIELGLEHVDNIAHVKEFEKNLTEEKLRIYTLTESFISAGRNQDRIKDCPHEVRIRKGPGKSIGVTPNTIFFDFSGSGALREYLLPRLLRHYNIPFYRERPKGPSKLRTAEFFKKRLCSSFILPGELAFHEKKVASIFDLSKTKQEKYIRAYIQLDDTYKELEKYANEEDKSMSLESIIGRKIEPQEIVDVMLEIVSESQMSPMTAEEWTMIDATK